MPTLGEFHTLVGQVFNLDDRMDAFIPAATRQAARWIERNQTIRYMKRTELYNKTGGTDNVLSIGAAGNVKGLDAVAIYEENNYDNLIAELDHEDLINTQTADEGVPSAFDYRTIILASDTDPADDAEPEIILDIVPAINYSFAVNTVRYSTWPTSLTVTHWLLENAEDILLARTCIQLGPIAREPEITQFYSPLLNDGLQTLLSAEQEHAEPASRPRKMRFGGST